MSFPMIGHKVLVQTKKDFLDSLKRPVKLAFTLTPIESAESRSCYPMTYKVMDFPINSEQTQVLEWGPGLGLGSYRGNGKDVESFLDFWAGKMPGRQIRMTSAHSGSSVQWAFTPFVGLPTQEMFRVINRTKSKRNFALHLESATGKGSYWPIAAYDSVENGAHITASVKLELQAYEIVHGAPGVCHILQAEDRTIPLLKMPIDCDTLSDISSWTLYQGSDGRVRLEIEDSSEGIAPASEALVRGDEESGSNQNVKTQLSEVLERLVDMEKSITRIQDDVVSGQQAIVDLRNEFLAEKTTHVTKEQIECMIRNALTPNAAGSAAPRVEPSDPILMAKTDKLAKSFGETQEYLTGVHEALRKTQDQVAILNRVVPGIERRTVRLVESFEETQEEVAAGRSRLAETDARVTRLGRRVGVVEATSESLLRHLGEIQVTSAPTSGSPVTFPSRLPEVPSYSEAGASHSPRVLPTSVEIPTLPPW